MATQNVCTWNKYGYCRYGEKCRELHVNEMCSNILCENSTCMLRHPIACKYFKRHNRCKFDPCAFKHKRNDFENLKKENQSLTIKQEAIDRNLKLLNEKEIESEMVIERFNNMEKNFKKSLQKNK